MQEYIPEYNVVRELCETITEIGLDRKQTLEVIVKFLYSVGHSLEECSENLTSEEVLKRYANKPTPGNALMAQALFMRDTWKID